MRDKSRVAWNHPADLLRQNLYAPSLDLQPTLTEQADCLGQQDPFGLLHDAPLEGFRCVAVQDLHGLLQHDGATVALIREEMKSGE